MTDKIIVTWVDDDGPVAFLGTHAEIAPHLAQYAHEYLSDEQLIDIHAVALAGIMWLREHASPSELIYAIAMYGNEVLNDVDVRIFDEIRP